jgi:Bacterial DNA-binding protein
VRLLRKPPWGFSARALRICAALRLPSHTVARWVMIKSELIRRLAEQNPHLFAKDIEKAVNAFFDAIVATFG